VVIPVRYLEGVSVRTRGRISREIFSSWFLGISYHSTQQLGVGALDQHDRTYIPLHRSLPEEYLPSNSILVISARPLQISSPAL
jgi:glycerol-3-phosphate O-acyltransferase